MTLVGDAKDSSRECQNNGHALSKKNVENEEKKILLVVLPDTIVDPRTVVIHSDNTTVAYAAVVNILAFELKVATVTANFVHHLFGLSLFAAISKLILFRLLCS